MTGLMGGVCTGREGGGYRRRDDDGGNGESKRDVAWLVYSPWLHNALVSGVIGLHCVTLYCESVGILRRVRLPGEATPTTVATSENYNIGWKMYCLCIKYCFAHCTFRSFPYVLKIWKVFVIILFIFNYLLFEYSIDMIC